MWNGKHWRGPSSIIQKHLNVLPFAQTHRLSVTIAKNEASLVAVHKAIQVVKDIVSASISISFRSLNTSFDTLWKPRKSEKYVFKVNYQCTAYKKCGIMFTMNIQPNI